MIFANPRCEKVAMARVLTWVSGKQLTGWACSACGWTFPLPSLLSDPEAKKAYDRLASAKFQRHDCATHQPVASLDPDSFIARAKGLVKRGFKPKDAAEIAASEIMFEKHDDPDIASKVQIEAQDFLHSTEEVLCFNLHFSGDVGIIVLLEHDLACGDLSRVFGLETAHH